MTRQYNAAVSVQPGPDNEPIICLHVSTAQVNFAFALGNEEETEEFRVELLKGLREATDAAKRARLGLLLPSDRQPLTIPEVNGHG